MDGLTASLLCGAAMLVGALGGTLFGLRRLDARMEAAEEQHRFALAAQRREEEARATQMRASHAAEIRRLETVLEARRANEERLENLIANRIAFGAQPVTAVEDVPRQMRNVETELQRLQRREARATKRLAMVSGEDAVWLAGLPVMDDEQDDLSRLTGTHE